MSALDEQFTAYVGPRRRRWVRVAYLLCGDWGHAEDITQIALAKLYVAWPRLRTDREPDAYVHKIVARAAMDERRRAWRREVPVVDASLMDVGALVGGADGRGEALRAAVLRLPLRQAQVVVLRYFSELSVRETATALGISSGSVKSHCARGLRSLNSDLANLSDEERIR